MVIVMILLIMFKMAKKHREMEKEIRYNLERFEQQTIYYDR